MKSQNGGRFGPTFCESYCCFVVITLLSSFDRALQNLLHLLHCLLRKRHFLDLRTVEPKFGLFVVDPIAALMWILSDIVCGWLFRWLCRLGADLGMSYSEEATCQHFCWVQELLCSEVLRRCCFCRGLLLILRPGTVFVAPTVHLFLDYEKQNHSFSISSRWAQDNRQTNFFWFCYKQAPL